MPERPPIPNPPTTANGILLQSSLVLAVPLRIADLEAAGGPTDADRARARAIADDLGAHGNDLLYRSATKGETERFFVELVQTIAVLSYAPLGIRIFGLHGQSGPQEVV
jgi:hypothetical protein